MGKTILVQGASISDFNGVSLNRGNIVTNPIINGAEELLSWWKTNPNTTSISKKGVWCFNSEDSVFTLSEVLKQNVGSTGPVCYMTTATITSLRLVQA